MRDENVEYYESLNLQLIPFNPQKSGGALWQSMCRLHHRKSRHYEGVSNPENSLAVKLRIVGQTDSLGSSNLLIRMVFRKRVEAGQTTVLWRAHTQGEGMLSDFQSDETGWSVIRPTDSATKSAVGMPTEILTFVRFIPNGEATGGDKIKVGQFFKLAETSGNEDGTEIVRMIESLLLDDDRSTRSLS